MAAQSTTAKPGVLYQASTPRSTVAAAATPAAPAAITATAVSTTTSTTATGIADNSNTYPLPAAWQGEATVDAIDLAQSAPPLEVVALQGNFQVSYVPAEDGDVLRILPDPATPGGQLQIVWRLNADSSDPALPAGQTIAFNLSARSYAPDTPARAILTDDSGSSSVLLDQITWTDYQVVREISADTGEVQIGLSWTGVPANAWLEVRGMLVNLDANALNIAPSPTDVAAAIASVPPTPQPTPTPTPTLAPLPTPTPRATPTPPLIIVTSTPTPATVFEEATRVAQATAWAGVLGPVTATPANLATATPTPPPIVVTSSPTPGNAATATSMALYATAVAFTTGTPTPIPLGAFILTATPTVPPTPRPGSTPRATATPTPLYVLLDDIPTPEVVPTALYPEEFYGKILFLASYNGDPRRPQSMIMNPDGTDIGLLTGRTFYDRAILRDAYSADMRYYAYARRAGGGDAANSGQVQIFYDDAEYPASRYQLTHFGVGVAWAPAWSPTGETVAFVSSESANDEIWIVQRDEWPPSQLTKNSWEWDHHPSFSPNGMEIVFTSNRVTGTRQLWVMNSGGGEQRQLTNFSFEAWDPVWVKYVDQPLDARSAEACDTNYSSGGICVPIAENLTCADVGVKHFIVTGADPHNFDPDQNGIGCEDGSN